MATYRMADGIIVKTENATQYWEEGTYFNGHNYISKATGSQWDHQTLYRSRRGRYYIEHTSQWRGSRSFAEWVSQEEAACWLLQNGKELPGELGAFEAQVSE